MKYSHSDTRSHPSSGRRMLSGARVTRYCAVLASAIMAAAAGVSTASAQTSYSLNKIVPDMDKWMYPFAAGGNGGGSRTPASVFGTVGEPDFDDRDAQFYNGFRTNGTIPSGRGAENYVILSATFTLRISRPELIGEDSPGFLYDATYDAYTTYGPNSVPVNDLDAGRPLELYGAGYRNSVTISNVQEGTQFSDVATGGPSTRNIYATDFHLGSSIQGSRDVSNNVSEAFDPAPFAIGQIAPDDLDDEGMPIDDALVTFTLNLANLDVVRYLQLSLNEGLVALMVTSLNPAEQGGPSVYPAFYTKENPLYDPGHLKMEVQIIPEPSAVTMALCGFGLFVACWRGRRAVINQEEIV